MRSHKKERVRRLVKEVTDPFPGQRKGNLLKLSSRDGQRQLPRNLQEEGDVLVGGVPDGWRSFQGTKDQSPSGTSDRQGGVGMY